MSEKYERVVASTRIRLARNFAEYPFPNRLSDTAVAREIVRLIGGALQHSDTFRLYYMNEILTDTAEYLKERHLISQALINNRNIGAAYITPDESISIMVNEEDHVRAQYFLNEFNLKRAYEMMAGIEENISATIPFAYDERLGYLTACPSNLGTGLRASVMLFLPALTRTDKMKDVLPLLNKLGLTVRGAFGEGSVAEGEMYQISNEVTLGYSEAELLELVQNAVEKVADLELSEREKMRRSDWLGLLDRVRRAYGVITHCIRLDAREFRSLMGELKFGVAMGALEGSMDSLDHIFSTLQPAGIKMISDREMGEWEEKEFRAEYAQRLLRSAISDPIRR